jgi:hypothetical protein
MRICAGTLTVVFLIAKLRAGHYGHFFHWQEPTQSATPTRDDGYVWRLGFSA